MLKLERMISLWLIMHLLNKSDRAAPNLSAEIHSQVKARSIQKIGVGLCMGGLAC